MAGSTGYPGQFQHASASSNNGKDGRFHRSLKAEVINGHAFVDHAHAQRAFDAWRAIYNDMRPHEAMDMVVPSARYRPSLRRFPEVLPAIDYAPDDTVLTVLSNGMVKFKGHDRKVSKALRGLPIAARPSQTEDGVYELYFSHHRLATDMREAD